MKEICLQIQDIAEKPESSAITFFLVLEFYSMTLIDAR